MKNLILTIVLLFGTTIAFTQQDQRGLIDSALIPIPLYHYQTEYNFDKSSNTSIWEKQKAGLNASFACTEETYFRTEAPQITQSQKWTATGWKGERLNIMLLVWSPDTINQVRLLLHDLKSSIGNLIGKSNLKPQLVRYVISNYPYGAREVTCGEGPFDKAYLMPDRLESFDRFDLPGKTVRRIWISLDIPSNAIAGSYESEIEIRSEKQNFKLQFGINVQGQSLPKPHD